MAHRPPKASLGLSVTVALHTAAVSEGVFGQQNIVLENVAPALLAPLVFEKNIRLVQVLLLCDIVEGDSPVIQLPNEPTILTSSCPHCP